MSSPYHFSSALPNRRQLLDHYSNLAHYSTIAPIIVYHLTSSIYQYLVYLATTSRFAKQASAKKDDDLDGSAGSVPGRRWAAEVLRVWRVVAWWLDGESSVGIVGWVFGERRLSRREARVTVVWVGWLGWCVFWGTGDDYLQLTKRFAIVAASQLPTHYLLSVKSPWNPIQRLLRVSHEELNIYHRLLGRIIVMFVLTHAALYLNFYIQSNLLLKRIKDLDVQLGLLAATSLILLGTTALSFIRTYSYRLFYTIHILVSITLLPILYFHVVHIRIYILETALIYLLATLHRILTTQLVSATLSPIKDTNLLSVSIKIPERSNTPAMSLPGQHIYISLSPTLHRLPTFTTNPFSISNLPISDADKTGSTTISLVMRTLNGTTKTLSNLAQTKLDSSSSSSGSSVSFLISTPYGSSRYFPPLLSYDHVLLVAGGVGITFTLPIYQSLLHQYEATLPPLPADPNIPPPQPKMTFIWSARRPEEMEWAIPKLYWTPEDENILLSRGRPAISKLFITSPGDFESAGRRRSVVMARPDFREIVGGIMEKKGVRRVAVLVCGPQSMVRDLRGELGTWVGKGVEVWWHAESFGW